MTKPKRLHDFDWGLLNTDENGKITARYTGYSKKAVKFLDLKFEAIKRIKKLEKDNKRIEGLKQLGSKECWESSQLKIDMIKNNAKIELLKEFFSIAEGDIKRWN